MFDSLEIFGLSYSATYVDVKAQYRAQARVYHSDKHNPERTGTTDDQANNHSQPINSACEYMKPKL